MNNDEERERELIALQNLHKDLLAYIALVSSGWAMLEFTINKCIWLLSQLNPVAGACITSQIVSMTPRIDCLLALMKLRSIDEKWVSELNKFKQSIHGTQEKRNRLIHDPVIFNGITKAAGQIEITAKGSPVFRIKEISLKDVKNLHAEIQRKMEVFGVIHEAIVHASVTLPDIPQPEADPMQVMMVLTAQNQPTG